MSGPQKVATLVGDTGVRTCPVFRLEPPFDGHDYVSVSSRYLTGRAVAVFVDRDGLFRDGLYDDHGNFLDNLPERTVFAIQEAPKAGPWTLFDVLSRMGYRVLGRGPEVA